MCESSSKRTWEYKNSGVGVFWKVLTDDRCQFKLIDEEQIRGLEILSLGLVFKLVELVLKLGLAPAWVLPCDEVAVWSGVVVTMNKEVDDEIALHEEDSWMTV